MDPPGVTEVNLMRLCQHADFEVLRRRRRTLPLAVSNSARHWLALREAFEIQNTAPEEAKSKWYRLGKIQRWPHPYCQNILQKSICQNTFNSCAVYTPNIGILLFGPLFDFFQENLNQRTSAKNHLPFCISVLMSFESIYYEKHWRVPSKYRTMPQWEEMMSTSGELHLLQTTLGSPSQLPTLDHCNDHHMQHNWSS